MFGDSTFVGAGASPDSRGDLYFAPAPAIQRAMDLRFGAGAVQVLNYAVMGTSSADLINGTDGVNSPWPQPATGDIVIVNHGINDQSKTPPTTLDQYRANVQAFAALPVPVVLQTPNPTYRGWENPAYAQAVRDVAASSGATLADVHQYVTGLASPEQYFPDQIHPNDVGYQLIIDNVTVPALMPLVERLKCR